MVGHLQKLWQELNEKENKKIKKTEENRKYKKKEGLEYPGEGAAIISAAGPFFF